MSYITNKILTGLSLFIKSTTSNWDRKSLNALDKIKSLVWTFLGEWYDHTTNMFSLEQNPLYPLMLKIFSVLKKHQFYTAVHLLTFLEILLVSFGVQFSFLLTLIYKVDSYVLLYVSNCHSVEWLKHWCLRWNVYIQMRIVYSQVHLVW